MTSIIALSISLIAIVISVYSWRKSRSIYDIKKYKFPKKVGSEKTEVDIAHEEALKNELKTGNWQILHIYERDRNDLMIVIGKLKKD